MRHAGSTKPYELFGVAVAYKACRIAGHDGEGIYVPSHDASSTDDGPSPYSDAWQNGDPSAYPYVSLKDNRTANDAVVVWQRHEVFALKVVRRRLYVNLGAHHYASSYVQATVPCDVATWAYIDVGLNRNPLGRRYGCCRIDISTTPKTRQVTVYLPLALRPAYGFQSLQPGNQSSHRSLVRLRKSVMTGIKSFREGILVWWANRKTQAPKLMKYATLDAAAATTKLKC